jgi:hypothetical protein
MLIKILIKIIKVEYSHMNIKDRIRIIIKDKKYMY